MKLSYRGVKDKAKIPTVATKPGPAIMGRYRGVELHTQTVQVQ